MIQHEEENPIALIEMQDGGVIAGKKAGDSSNPFRSGRSYFQVNLFFRSQNFTLDLGDFDIKTVGIIFGLIYACIFTVIICRSGNPCRDWYLWYTNEIHEDRIKYIFLNF